jgi:hypothetical protein
VDYQNENSGQPRIVGFESQPIPGTSSADIKKFALIGVGVVFALFLLLSPGIPTPGSAATMQKKKYVPPKTNGPAYKSIEEARSAVNNAVDQHMKKNSEIFRSFQPH